MTAEKKLPKLFLSHAAIDKPLVEAFENLLTKSMGLTSEDVFCSSLEGQGVIKGRNFVEEIREHAEKAKGVVALLTPAYLDSPFCMAELGAAWVLQTHRLPIVVPPNTFKIMDATLLGIAGVSIVESDQLVQAFEDLAKSIGINSPAIAIRQRAMREFKQAWESLKYNISPATRIEQSVHSDVILQRNEALEARDAAVKDLSKVEAKIKALEKIKDADEVAKINSKFGDSSWEDKLEDAFSLIRDLCSELGGKEIVRLLILDHLGKETRPNFVNSPDESNRAIELDVFDNDKYTWNYDHQEVKRLFEIIDEVCNIIDGNPEIKKQLKSQNKNNNPTLIRFWEKNLWQL